MGFKFGSIQTNNNNNTVTGPEANVQNLAT